MATSRTNPFVAAHCQPTPGEGTTAPIPGSAVPLPYLPGGVAGTDLTTAWCLPREGQHQFVPAWIGP